MIRLEHAGLPRGLRAFVTREGQDIIITVSATLPADIQRAAVGAAINAAKRAGWLRHRLLPPAVWIPLGAAALWAVVRRPIAEAGPAHVAATVTAAAVTVAAVTLATPSKPGPISLRPVAPIVQRHHRRRQMIAVPRSRPALGRASTSPVRTVTAPHPSSGSGQAASTAPAPSSNSPGPLPSVSVSAGTSLQPSPSPSPAQAAPAAGRDVA